MIESPWKVAIAIGLDLVLVKALPHIDRYLKQTPLQRCMSSKNTAIHMADYECRIELGMGPTEKPVSNEKKKVTLSTEDKAKLDAIFKEQRKVTLSVEDRAALDAIFKKSKEEKEEKP